MNSDLKIAKKTVQTEIDALKKLQEYGINNYKDILELGMFDISKDHIKIIEWPELIESKPKDRIDILFQYSKLKDSRKVKVIGFGKWKDYKFDKT